MAINGYDLLRRCHDLFTSGEYDLIVDVPDGEAGVTIRSEVGTFQSIALRDEDEHGSPDETKQRRWGELNALIETFRAVPVQAVHSSDGTKFPVVVHQRVEFACEEGELNLNLSYATNLAPTPGLRYPGVTPPPGRLTLMSAKLILETPDFGLIVGHSRDDLDYDSEFSAAYRYSAVLNGPPWSARGNPYENRWPGEVEKRGPRRIDPRDRMNLIDEGYVEF